MLARWLSMGFLVLSMVVSTGKSGAWTSEEYVRQYSLRYLGKVPLPHLGNAEQALLFGQLIDRRNIALIVNSAESVDFKLLELRKILATVSAYRASYNLAMTYGEPLQQELTRVQVFAMEVAAAVAAMTQQQGEKFYSAHDALATQIAGMIQSIAEEQRFSDDERAELAEAIARLYPGIAPVLTDDDRQHLFDQISRLDIRATTSRQRAAVTAMWSALEKAL